jgi:hypothetical protein
MENSIPVRSLRLAKSYVDLQLLPSEPDPAKLHTEAFLPKK